MAVSTTAEKNNLATKYGTDGAYVALFSTVPSGGSPGTELTGGTYARVAAGWGAASNGVISGSATLNVPSGATVAGVGLFTASTGGTYIDGGSVTSQTFGTAGTYTVTLTYTQS
jgi:hypothetical protein